MVLPMEYSEPYSVLTRVRSALLMGKHLGLKYDCTNGDALYQIAAHINARIHFLGS